MFLALDCKNFDRIVAGSPELTARNNHLVVAFDAAALETIELRFRLPSDYASGSNMTGTLTMVSASATTGNVRARLAFERVQTGTLDIDADSFDADVEANAAANATSGITFTASFTLANGDIDGAAAGDWMRVRISRVGTDGTNDTMTGDAQFVDLVLSQ
jgi:phage tail sheath gpL-like